VQLNITTHAELATLTHLFSIDNVAGQTVSGYATADEITVLRAHGYQLTLLPSPGKSPHARMGLFDRSGRATWDAFPTYAEYVSTLSLLAAKHGSICEWVEIGDTSNQLQPHKLLALKITSHPNVEADKPEVFLTAAMHGDETTGYVLLLRFVDEVLRNYGTDPMTTALVDNVELWVNPLANPDGTYFGGDDTVADAIRDYTDADGNDSGIDPNRDFPILGASVTMDAWRETQAMMTFAAAHSFVLSANFHGGAEVLNYPWDTVPRAHVDSDWFIQVASAYAAQAMADGPTDYMRDVSDTGIIGGYAWYEADGTRQDYMTYRGDREITMEISSIKNPEGPELPVFWEANRLALYQYVQSALTGVRGVVTDSTGLPLAAQIEVLGHDSVRDNSYVSTDPDVGDYHRLIAPGAYSLRFRATGYRTKEIANVVVTSGAATRLDVTLAEETEPLTITGTVTTADSALPIAAATISLAGTNLSASSDLAGHYRLANVSAGTYMFSVVASGFAPLVVEREIGSNSLTYDFALTLAQGSGYQSDFEADDGGLATDSATSWSWGPLVSCPAAHSGANVWAASRSGYYGNDADLRLLLPDILVPEGFAQLSFWHWYDFENGSEAWDGGNVGVVTAAAPDDVELLAPQDGYPEASITALGAPGYGGQSGGWLFATFDLSAYAGNRITLVWHLASDASITRRGWLIDDIQVGEAAPSRRRRPA